MTDAKLTHPTIGYRPVLIGDRLIGDVMFDDRNTTQEFTVTAIYADPRPGRFEWHLRNTFNDAILIPPVSTAYETHHPMAANASMVFPFCQRNEVGPPYEG